ncbi:pyruvate kinase [Candidatus Uhrbacteria bacterium]|nr:pyruvate kinase [Candidatus Uhrbacteria bacterium]
MRRTKIVCTIGPASASPTKLHALMRAGMDVARLNLSHGTHRDHHRILKTIRQTARELGKPVAIVGDLQGPKIRLGELPAAGVALKAHSSVVINSAATTFQKGELPVTYANLFKDVNVGERLLIDDGLLELKITRVAKKKIYATVVNGGTVTSHKGMNFPDSQLSLSSLTSKDREDVVFAVGQGVDWVALSFVKSVADVKLLRRLIAKASKPGMIKPLIIVKIEKHEAVANFDAILEEADGVMVARGDLGIEVPAQEVPVIQKTFVEKCRKAGKPVIVATQMLDSMIRNPRPTRAEVSDVANAVFDHTDAVMLSGETASGKYPVQAVKMMASIVQEAERSVFDDVTFFESSTTDAVAALSQQLKLAAVQGSIEAVVASLELASWAPTIHREHPEIPLFLACSSQEEARQNVLRWGVQPLVLKNAREQTFARRAFSWLLKEHLLKSHAHVALVLGGRHGKAFDVVEAKG